MVKFNTDLSKS